MSQKRKWILVGVTTAAGLAACAPNVVGAYNDWKAERRKALIEKTEAALAQGLDYVPWWDDLTAGHQPADDTLMEAEAPGDAVAEEKEERDDADLRRLAMQAELGPRSPSFHQHLMQLAAVEARRWHGDGAEAPARPSGAPSTAAPASSSPASRTTARASASSRTSPSSSSTPPRTGTRFAAVTASARPS
jgi:hypothetical protein